LGPCHIFETGTFIMASASLSMTIIPKEVWRSHVAFSVFRTQVVTRHRASRPISMYSLTFCVLVVLPESHQWKPAVQAAAVMLRTPPCRRPVTGQPATRASHIRRGILRTPPRHPPVTGQQRAHTPPDGRSHYVVISRRGRKLVTRVGVILP